MTSKPNYAPKSFYSYDVKPAQTMRERVERLEHELNQLPQVDCPIEHHFAPNAYARKISIKAGVCVTGAIHKTEHLIAICKGRLRIVTDDGTTEVKAGDVITCKPGMKNAVAAIEDSVWVNFFPTTETDPDALVEILTESKASELIGGSANKQLTANAAKAQLKE